MILSFPLVASYVLLLPGISCIYLRRELDKSCHVFYLYMPMSKDQYCHDR
jgi:hypothetical protein